MGGILRVFAVRSNPKDVPGSREHWVHGGTGSWEELDEGSNCDSGKELFDDIVVRSKVELPVELSDILFKKKAN